MVTITYRDWAALEGAQRAGHQGAALPRPGDVPARGAAPRSSCSRRTGTCRSTELPLLVTTGPWPQPRPGAWLLRARHRGCGASTGRPCCWAPGRPRCCSRWRIRWWRRASRSTAGVADDPFGRLRRTLLTTLDMVFGDGPTAERAVRRLNGVHGAVRGAGGGPGGARGHRRRSLPRDGPGAAAVGPGDAHRHQSVDAYTRWVGPLTRGGPRGVLVGGAAGRRAHGHPARGLARRLGHAAGLVGSDAGARRPDPGDRRPRGRWRR